MDGIALLEYICIEMFIHLFKLISNLKQKYIVSSSGRTQVTKVNIYIQAENGFIILIS